MRAFIDADQGPLQEFCAAIRPICFARQSRADDVSPVTFLSAESLMNARSFHEPSPLMSPPTVGVNGSPDDTLPIAVRLNPFTLLPVCTMNRCRGVNRSCDHSAMRGSPSVLASNPRVRA